MTNDGLNMKKFLCGVIFLMMVSPLSLAESFVAGKHYEVLPSPVVTRDKSKVEVVELFWFGCIHCFHFEPVIQAWKKQQADDVDFHSMPAMWNKDMQLHAKAFYAAKALGKFDQLSEAMFTAMNVNKNRLKSEKAIQSLFAKNGVDEASFKQVFNSFGVNSQVNLADSRARAYRLQGTPELVVNGKYRVATSLAGSQAKMLEVVDFLVAKERALLAQ